MKLLKLTFVTLMVLLVAGCSEVNVPLPGNNSAATIKIQSIPLKIALAAGGAVLQVAIEEFAGIRIDANDLLDEVASDADVTRGIPPADDEPILMIVNKQTNDILYWKLTNKVKMIRLRHEDAGGIELKVMNETPLRIELWMDAGIEEVKIEVEMQE